ncbi:MAG: carboxymethylenebutenolidase [Gammaproteobacteria bacterium]|nr:carboxymethylenebutenolidase [Gammaproteobacteria bacterium]|tara:strand:- start:5314 stop:5985 length:672 start_codon:yes stop_codon:yes gene_type:complete
MGEAAQITADDGFTLGAYQAGPAGAPKGAVVVIQEIFGVNSHIREVVDGYAEAGYFAIAPQIFDRVERNIELGYEDADMGAGIEVAFQKLDHESALKDLQAAIDVASVHGKVGVVGYCFGGLLTWRSACELNNVAAASSYYGGGLAAEADRTPRCPVIMHFGELDAHIPMSDVDKVKAAQPDIPVYVYPADHGFNCDHRASYDEQAAAQARERTLALFAEKLS